MERLTPEQEQQQSTSFVKGVLVAGSISLAGFWLPVAIIITAIVSSK